MLNFPIFFLSLFTFFLVHSYSFSFLRIFFVVLCDFYNLKKWKLQGGKMSAKVIDATENWCKPNKKISRDWMLCQHQNNNSNNQWKSDWTKLVYIIINQIGLDVNTLNTTKWQCVKFDEHLLYIYIHNTNIYKFRISSTFIMFTTLVVEQKLQSWFWRWNRHCFIYGCSFALQRHWLSFLYFVEAKPSAKSDSNSFS